MPATKWLFRNLLIIGATILTLVTAVVISQSNAMVTLGYCSIHNTACIIEANLIYILCWTFIIVVAVLFIAFVIDITLRSYRKPNIILEKCNFQIENKNKIHQYEKYVGIRFTNSESSRLSNVWVKLNKMVFVYEDEKVKTIELNKDNLSFSWRDEKDERIYIAGGDNKVLNIARENLQHVDFLMYKETSYYLTFWQNGDSEKDGSTSGVFEIEIEINGDYGDKKDFHQKSFWRIMYKSPTLPIGPNGVQNNRENLAVIDILKIPSMRKFTESDGLKEDTYPKFLQKVAQELSEENKRR